MIIIDQHRIDNSQVISGPFPRDQKWWDGFTGVGTTATVRADGTVTLEPDGTFYDYDTWMSQSGAERTEDCPVGKRTMTAHEKRKAEMRLADRLPALLGAAIVDVQQEITAESPTKLSDEAEDVYALERADGA